MAPAGPGLGPEAGRAASTQLEAVRIDDIVEHGHLARAREFLVVVSDGPVGVIGVDEAQIDSVLLGLVDWNEAKATVLCACGTLIRAPR